MPEPEDWCIPEELRPRPVDLGYDVEEALDAVVSLEARVPEDAYTAEALGTFRSGQGVQIRPDGLVLTIGYLIAEAQEVTLATNDGLEVPAHPIAYDYETGFGLVKALRPLNVPALGLGDAGRLPVGAPVTLGGAGGLRRSLAARVVARQEFAGYWEYLLDDALFTAPAHPHWGGAALIGPDGALLGIGSLQLQHQAPGGRVVPLNMSVPVDLLKPVLDDLLAPARRGRPARPWLGLYAGEDEDDRVIIVGLAGDGPARRAGLKEGDVVRAVAGKAATSLAGFYRALWATGSAGVDVPLTLEREGDVFGLVVTSADRSRFLKAVRLH